MMSKDERAAAGPTAGGDEPVWVSVETLKILLAAGKTARWHGERLEAMGKPAALMDELRAAIAEADRALAFVNIAETARRIAAAGASKAAADGEPGA